MPVKVALYGIGEIGRRVARLLLARGDFEVVGAFDVDLRKVGKDLGEIAGWGKSGILVEKPYAGCCAGADVTIHATVSSMTKAYPQLMEIVEGESNVVSTCEEMVFPLDANRELARAIDVKAKEKGVSVVAAGVNPGFLMDLLPIFLTFACQEVREIRVKRIIDASSRRMSFQRKVGVGLTLEEFYEMRKRGEISGHIGLKESLSLVAHALGWQISEFWENFEPIVERNRVLGVRQRIEGEGEEGRIELIFEAYHGAESRDLVEIEGRPKLRVEFKGGVHGDEATVAILVNIIPRVLEAPPGFLTLLDLKVPH